MFLTHVDMDTNNVRLLLIIFSLPFALYLIWIAYMLYENK